MAKKMIRLTESDLHRIVKESAHKILRETDLSSLSNPEAFKNAIGGENVWHVQSQPYEHSEEESFTVATKLLNNVGANTMYIWLCRFIVSKYGPDVLYNLLFGVIRKYTSIKWEALTR